MAAVAVPILFLRAKLHPPRLGRDIVARQRLVRRLEAGLQGNLTLVSAPAGFGKTTLLSSWIQHNQRPAAWLSLDEQDNQPSTFLANLAAAIQTVFPGACPGLGGLVELPESLTSPLVVSLLSNELEELPEDLALILDDYHVVESTEIHALISALVERPPQGLHLVIASRVDPPLPLGRLRGTGQLAEVRAADLRFSSEESRTFLQQIVGELDDESLLRLEERTEGWAAGLRLAASSMLGSEDRPAFIRAFAETVDRHAMEFLVREVLLSQDEFVREFLLSTSIVDRFCGGLCDALLRLPAGASRTLLDRLDRDALFVVPLDDHHGWYRYHHLFRDLLRHRLRSKSEPEAVADLHRRAAEWFALHGDIDEALAHAMAAGDGRAGARIIEHQVHETLDREEWPRLSRWLDMLPEEEIVARPGLLVARAWVLVCAGRLAAVPFLVRSAERLVETDPQATDELRAEIELLGYVEWLYRRDPREASFYLNRAQRALARMSPDAHHARGWAVWMLWRALTFVGETLTARRVIHDALADDSPYRSGPGLPLLLLAADYYVDGQLYRAEESALDALAFASRTRRYQSRGWAHLQLGLIYLAWNDLHAARKHFSDALDLRSRVSSVTARDASLGLALTYHALGERERAWETVAVALELSMEMDASTHLPTVRACQARMALAEGDLPSAIRYAEAAEGHGDTVLSIDLVRVTQARVLVAAAKSGSHDEALVQVAAALAHCDAEHLKPCTIGLLAVGAVALHRSGRTEQAFVTLRRAVGLARPGGFIRPFADLGAPMADLLLELSRHDRPTPFLSRLIDGVSSPERGPRSAQSSPTPARMAGLMPRMELLEVLTQREVEVLELLGDRLSNKEIARVLVISPLTVKRHTINLYQKLQVNGRRQAVARARQLGLLPAV